MLDGYAVLNRRGQLGQILAEPAIAGHRDDRPRRVRGPRAQRGGVAKSDGAEVAGHQHGLSLGLEVAPEGVGVVADIDREDGLGRSQARQHVEDRG
jgi:hypothetical protein